MRTRPSILAAAVASAVVASAATASAAPCNTLLAGTSRYCSQEGRWGNGDFNASYSIWLGFSTKDDVVSTSPPIVQPALESAFPDDFINLGGQLDAYVTVFGREENVVHAHALARRASGAISSSYRLDVLGVVLATGSLSSTLSLQYNRTFFQQSKTYAFGLIPVTVHGAAHGALGLDVSANLSQSAFALTGTPYARAYVTASVGVGASCISAGVEGSLTAVKAETPIHGKLSFPSASRVDYGITGDLELSTLDGEIGLYGEVCGVGADLPIFSWDGRELASIRFLDSKGTLSL